VDTSTSCGGKAVGIYFVETGASQRPSKVITTASCLHRGVETGEDRLGRGLDGRPVSLVGHHPALSDPLPRSSKRRFQIAHSKKVTVSVVQYRKNCGIRKSPKVMTAYGIRRYALGKRRRDCVFASKPARRCQRR
jgi:2-dehydro-3-deoxygluconokinase